MAAQTKQLLILKVGEVQTSAQPAGLLAANVDLLWNLHGGDDAPSPARRDLLVRRDLIEIALGEARKDVDRTDGDYSEKSSQRAASLLKMLDTTEAALAALAEADDAALAPTGAAIGELATIAPESPPRGPLPRPFGPDATDPAYWGSPYRADRGGRW